MHVTVLAYQPSWNPMSDIEDRGNRNERIHEDET
jgi:hypothetical protein